MRGRAELRPLADAIAMAFPNAEVYNAHPTAVRRRRSWAFTWRGRSRGSAIRQAIARRRSEGRADDPAKRNAGPVAADARLDVRRQVSANKDWWWTFVLKK